jgi:hypothetical protein
MQTTTCGANEPHTWKGQPHLKSVGNCTQLIPTTGQSSIRFSSSVSVAQVWRHAEQKDTLQIFLRLLPVLASLKRE